MLRSEHVPGRVIRGTLVVPEPTDHFLSGARKLARDYLGLIAGGVGRTRGEIDEELDAVEVPLRSQQLAAGLRKLLDDRCVWESPTDDPAGLRAAVFERAAVARQQGRFDRQAVLAEVGATRGLTANQVDEALFGDLKEQQRLVSLEPIVPDALVEAWRLGLSQAVLLRATRVRVELTGAAAAWRPLFARLKFLRLLFAAERSKTGLRLEIDGPHSLFAATTKYGLQLAMLLPLLRDAGPFRLTAELVWGPRKQRCRYLLEGGDPVGVAEGPLPDDLAPLAEAWAGLESGWRMRRATDLLEVRGLGVVLPDLVFERDGQRVYLELLGYWSREAVWRRIELVERGLRERVVFALSERLRVSQEALPDELPAALVVYKGVLRPKAVLAAVEAVSKRPAGKGR